VIFWSPAPQGPQGHPPLPEAPAAVGRPIGALPHGDHLPRAEGSPQEHREGALDVQDGGGPLPGTPGTPQPGVGGPSPRWCCLDGAWGAAVQLLGWYLQLPDVLALLGDLAHGLAHEGDEHVEEEHEGEDDVGHEEDDEDAGVLGALEHLQVAHADGELEEVEQEGAEGLAVPARGVGGHRAVGLLLAAGLAAGTWVEEGHQSWGRGTVGPWVQRQGRGPRAVSAQPCRAVPQGSSFPRAPARRPGAYLTRSRS